ncbi:helix-turn-helix domain-containing protein [Streptomyces sp. NPDC048172]|uniref:helix-turn-helix domain-containing protein n=1 Tax=Streptomyces sp. NPDC048172 TaxID=3365505 RepID=UPI003712F0FC
MTTPGPDASGGTFAADVTASTTVAARFGRFWREWEAQLGTAHPTPDFTPGSTGDFRLSARAVTAHDAVIADVHSESLVGTNSGSPQQNDEQVVLHVVRRNAWRFSRARGDEHTVRPGQFLLQRSGPPTYEEARHTSAKVLLLPASPLSRLIRDRLVAGPTSSPEARLLLGHLRLVEETAGDLGPSGALAARDALLELVKGVLGRRADSADPLLGPALAQAARDLADRRLTDPGLSPAALARELHVSVRTLHRAFAASGADEGAAAYVRRRRLEEARLALLGGGPGPGPRPSVSEVAARWQFSDSSHFIRAFKRRYGHTPASRVTGLPEQRP